MYQRFFKRLGDLILSGLALLILAVPLLILGLIVKLDSKGQIGRAHV